MKFGSHRAFSKPSLASCQLTSDTLAGIWLEDWHAKSRLFFRKSQHIFLPYADAASAPHAALPQVNRITASTQTNTETNKRINERTNEPSNEATKQVKKQDRKEASNRQKILQNAHTYQHLQFFLHATSSWGQSPRKPAEMRTDYGQMQRQAWKQSEKRKSQKRKSVERRWKPAKRYTVYWIHMKRWNPPAPEVQGAWSSGWHKSTKVQVYLFFFGKNLLFLIGRDARLQKNTVKNSTE